MDREFIEKGSLRVQGSARAKAPNSKTIAKFEYQDFDKHQNEIPAVETELKA